jgi:dihydroflavonol-4-reductase
MILITGAAGRIGNVLVKELNRKGKKVKVLEPATADFSSLKGCSCSYIYGDILDVSTFEDKLDDVDAIFHLAANINISSYGKNSTFDTNIQGTKNVVDLCLKHNIKLVYVSSIHALATLKDQVIDENTPLCIDTKEKRGIYDRSKALATKIVMDAKEKGLKSIIFFPTGVSGPFDYKPSFFGEGMIQLVKSGLKFTIGGQYDYVDVRDVVNGIMRAFSLRKFGEKYILSGEIVNMSTYVKYLREFEGKTFLMPLKVVRNSTALFLGFLLSIFNKKSKITLYSVKTLTSNCNISHAKATKELGYLPRSVKESLYEQYLWFKKRAYF